MYTAVNLGSVTAPHKKAQEDLPIVDLIIEPQTVVNFLSSAAGHPLPDGSQPPGGRLQDSEIPVLQGNFPPGSNGDSIVNQVMIRLSTEECTIGLGLVGQNVKSLKSRLWEGIVPLSEQRWREKGLDLPENFNYAIQHLTAVLMVFEYINQPRMRIALRNTFNFIHGKWAELDVELNRLRAERGEESISVAGLWTAYMTAKFQTMAQRAHDWVLGRAEGLRGPLMEQIRTYVPSNEGPQSHMRRPDQTQWLISDRIHMLHETIVKADYAIMTLMDEGFKGYTRPPIGSGPANFYLADCSRRGAAYAQRMKALSHEIMFERMIGIVTLHSSSETSGESLYQSTMDQVTALQRVREQLRGPPVSPLPQEPWILNLLSTRKFAQEHNKPMPVFGFVIYRLTYGQTDAEWAAFVKKLEAHMNNWGGWQTGADLIKPHINLVWKDGKEHGLPEDDVNAAKAHFLENEEDPNVNILQRNAFLVVDSASYDSYMTLSYTAATPLVLAGDSTGFVLAIEPQFDAAEGPSRPDESPGYMGQVRILGSLVWGDLFALLETQSFFLEQIWPLAIDHPNQVYTGPTVPLQVFNWRTQNAARTIFMRGIIDHAKRKLGMPVTTPPRPANQPRNPAFTTVLPEVPRNTGTVYRAEQPPLHRVAQDPRLDEFENYLRDHNRGELAERVVEMRRQFNEAPDISQIVQAMGQFERERQPDAFAEQSPADEDPMRDMILSEFQQYLLRNDQHAHAETVERMRQNPPRANPYPEGMMERVRNFEQLLEERRRARSRPNEEESNEDQSQDPPQ